MAKKSLSVRSFLNESPPSLTSDGWPLAQRSPPQLVPVARTKRRDGDPATILVADDEPDLREILVSELQQNGYRTLEAATGAEAFELVRQHAVDAVITDLCMPNGDGIELLARIKKHEPTLPVILVTGFTAMSEPEILRRGATAMLGKPCNGEEILDCLRKALKG